MNKIKKLLLSLTAIISAVALVSCGGIKTNCKTGWKVGRYDIKDATTGETVTATQSVYLYVTSDSGKIKEVWFNFGEFSAEETEVYLNRYGSSDYKESSTASYKSECIVSKSQAEKSESGWVRVVSEYDLSSSYLKISVGGGVKINEIVVLDAKGDKMKATLKRAELLIKEDGVIRGKTYGEDELKSSDIKDGPNNLFDEQEKFDKK